VCGSTDQFCRSARDRKKEPSRWRIDEMKELIRFSAEAKAVGFNRTHSREDLECVAVPTFADPPRKCRSCIQNFLGRSISVRMCLSSVRSICNVRNAPFHFCFRQRAIKGSE
jgi:hypothetical protein